MGGSRWQVVRIVSLVGVLPSILIFFMWGKFWKRFAQIWNWLEKKGPSERKMKTKRSEKGWEKKKDKIKCELFLKKQERKRKPEKQN